MKSFLKIALYTFCLLLPIFIFSSHAYAWKVGTHVYSSDLLMDEMKQNDGCVEIPQFGKIPVVPEYREAIEKYPEYFRAGAMGPDVFPDIYVGQMFIHPGDDKNFSSGQWVNRMWQWVLNMPTDNRDSDPNYADSAKTGQLTPENKKKCMAFVLGFTVHASGDFFGHAYINDWAGGVWPPLSEIKKDGSIDIEKVNIIIRHNVVEAYIDKQIPSDYTKGDRIKISTPRHFILDTMISNGGMVNSDNMGSDTRDISPLFKSEQPKHFAMFFDLRNSLKNRIHNGSWLSWYYRYWMDDIDGGLWAWTDTSEKIAQDMLQPDGFGKAGDELGNWASHNLLSMLGIPDWIEWIFSSVSDAMDAAKSLLPDAIKEEYDRLKDGFIDTIFEYYLPFSYTELKNIFKNPETYLQSSEFFPDPNSMTRLKNEMGNFSKSTDPNNQTFIPFANTLTMAKLTLIGHDGLNELRRRAGTKEVDYNAYTNMSPDRQQEIGIFPNDLFVKFVKSFDAGYSYRTPGMGECELWTNKDDREKIAKKIFVFFNTDYIEPGGNINENTLAPQILTKNETYDRYCDFSSGTLDLNGKTLVINGTLLVRSGKIDVRKGSLIVKGDLIMAGGQLDVNNGNVSVLGKLSFTNDASTLDLNYGALNAEKVVLWAGMFDVHGGSVIVNGDFVMSYDIERGDYSYNCGGTGRLKMTNSKDFIEVYGDFVTTSYMSHDGLLTDGSLYIQGNFIQASGQDGYVRKTGNEYNSPAPTFDTMPIPSGVEDNSYANFRATGNHKVVLCGNNPQTIYFKSAGLSRLSTSSPGSVPNLKKLSTRLLPVIEPMVKLPPVKKPPVIQPPKILPPVIVPPNVNTNTTNDSCFNILEITNTLIDMRDPVKNRVYGSIFTESGIAVRKLFQHNGKAIMLKDPGKSYFVDYDGDGLKDNVDPKPAIPLQQPVVDSKYPAIYEGSVKPLATVKVVFDQEIKAVNLKGIYIRSDTLNLASGVSAEIGSDKKSIVISHSPFNKKAGYMVVIPAGAVKSTKTSLSGKEYYNTLISWRFTAEGLGITLGAKQSNIWDGLWEVSSIGTITLGKGKNGRIAGTCIKGQNIIDGTAIGNKFTGTINFNGIKQKITLTLSADGKSVSGTLEGGTLKAKTQRITGYMRKEIIIPEIKKKPVPIGEKDWSGTWYSDMGTTIMAQSGNEVYGTFGLKEYAFMGTLSGNTLKGQINLGSKISSFELKLAPDGKGFTGSFDSSGSSKGSSWQGTKR